MTRRSKVVGPCCSRLLSHDELQNFEVSVVEGDENSSENG